MPAVTEVMWGDLYAARPRKDDKTRRRDDGIFYGGGVGRTAPGQTGSTVAGGQRVAVPASVLA